MKDFTRPRGRLRALPLPARLVYTIFLAFTLAGMSLSLWLTHDMVGLDLAELDAYYAGVVEAPATPEPEAMDGNGAGPILDLPEEADAPPTSEPMPLRKALEVTHFHLFSMPVYLMILSHLFMLSRMGERAKIGWIAAATAATIAHMMAPWWARAGGTAPALFYGSSGALLLVTFTAMCLVPLREMWSDPR